MSETPKKGFWSRLLGVRSESAPLSETPAEPVAVPETTLPETTLPRGEAPAAHEAAEPADLGAVPEPEVLEPAAGEEVARELEVAAVEAVADDIASDAEPFQSLKEAEGLPPPTAELAPMPAAPQPEKKSFWSRLTSGLSRTASALTQGITDLVSKRKLDAATLEELEDILIRADLGVAASARIVETVGRGRHDKMIAPEEVKGLIAAEVESILTPVAKPLVIDRSHKPFILLMVGVNGSGKTTTIGKLAAQWRAEGLKVMLAAGDTFRAAAIEQLKVWGERTGATVIARAPGADAAGVAFDAITEARASGADVLLIDTAGRLQNRAELMAELEKVVRVVRKQEPTAPHAVLLVLDATVGQNALSQVEVFGKVAGVTGLVMTKLDGTARGGILVAIAEKHRLPVHLIGVGEGADDLQPFAARDFARAIAGL